MRLAPPARSACVTAKAPGRGAPLPRSPPHRLSSAALRSYSDTRKPLVEDASHSASEHNEPRPLHPHALKANGHMRSEGHIGGIVSELAAPAVAAPRRQSAAEDRWLGSSQELMAGATVTSVTIVLDDSPVELRRDAGGGACGGYVGGMTGEVALPEGVVDASPRRHPAAAGPDWTAPVPHATSGSLLEPRPPVDGGAAPPVQQAPASPRVKPALHDGVGAATELSAHVPAQGAHETLSHLATSVSNVSSAAAKLKHSRRSSIIESSLPVNSHGERMPVRLLPAALNKNKVHEFGWVAPVLQAIVSNAQVPVEDLHTGTRDAGSERK